MATKDNTPKMDINDKVRIVPPIGTIVRIDVIRELKDGNVETTTKVTVQYESGQKSHNMLDLEIAN